MNTQYDKKKMDAIHRKTEVSSDGITKAGNLMP